MAKRITLIDVNGEVFYVDIPDGELVLTPDGEFVSPDEARFILTITKFVTEGEFYPLIENTELVNMLIGSRFSYKVLGVSETPVVENPDPSIVTVLDPTGGECICGITCLGPKLSYVKVYPV